MENGNKSKNLLKMILPIVIVVAIGGIWLIKNNEKAGEIAPVVPDNADFALQATAIDLEKLKSYGIPILIDFGADNCGPCREMAPVLVELNATYQGKVIIKYVDVWEDQGLAEGFPVEVTPTQFFFDKEGKPYVPSDPEGMQMMLYSLKETNTHVYTAHQGAMSKEQILDVFKELGVELDD